MDESPETGAGPAVRIAWTTVETEEAADVLAGKIVGSRLAACVQIDGPVRSLYRWKGAVADTREFRLWIKFPADKGEALFELVQREHPYEVPQWVVVQAAAVSQAYGEWVRSTDIN